jgi:hypothetical protein
MADVADILILLNTEFMQLKPGIYYGVMLTEWMVLFFLSLTLSAGLYLMVIHFFSIFRKRSTTQDSTALYVGMIYFLPTHRFGIITYCLVHFFGLLGLISILPDATILLHGPFFKMEMFFCIFSYKFYGKFRSNMIDLFIKWLPPNTDDIAYFKQTFPKKEDLEPQVLDTLIRFYQAKAFITQVHGARLDVKIFKICQMKQWQYERYKQRRNIKSSR